MKSVSIKLPTIEAVQNFVDIVSDYEEDISLSSGRYIVDAKSIMGIFALDTLSPINLVAHTDNAEDFFAAIDAFIVK